MTIPIPYAMDYTSTMSGAVLKLVRCEHCGTEYVYKMQRMATGEGTSFLFLDNHGAADRAAARAEETLQRKLERGVDLVPCPTVVGSSRTCLPRPAENTAVGCSTRVLV
jgi:hypothetical protein